MCACRVHRGDGAGQAGDAEGAVRAGDAQTGGGGAKASAAQVEVFPSPRVSSRRHHAQAGGQNPQFRHGRSLLSTAFTERVHRAGG